MVDPGVGGGRRDLCIVTGTGRGSSDPTTGCCFPPPHAPAAVSLAIALDAEKIDRDAPLPTFHARDVLAPAAAALACGVEPRALGAEIDVRDRSSPAPFGTYALDGGYVNGEVLEADRFGSLRFNIPAEDLEQLGLRVPRLEIGIGHNSLTVPFATTFSDVAEGEPVALVDSSGWLTLAVNTGSAADRYGVEPGAHVRVRALS